MSEPIKVGDLVMVVRACCNKYPHHGKIFSIEEIWEADTFSYDCCKKQLGLRRGVSVSERRYERHCIPLSYLKRIDPPSDEMKRETEKELENV